jgi:hypothetical protein
VAVAKPCVQPQPVTPIGAQLFSSLPEMQRWDLAHLLPSSTGLRMSVWVGTNMFVTEDCKPHLKVATWYGLEPHGTGEHLTRGRCMSCVVLACP